MNYEPDGTRAAVAEASRHLFRRENRLDVLALIAARGQHVFFAKELAAVLKIGDNQITPELAMLRTLGAVEPIDGPERQNYHRAVAHPIWPFAIDMVARTVARRWPDTAEATLRAYVLDRYNLADVPARLAAALSATSESPPRE